jgi:hypothetical protein
VAERAGFELSVPLVLARNRRIPPVSFLRYEPLTSAGLTYVARPVGVTLRGHAAHGSRSEAESKGDSTMASGTALLVVWTDIAPECEADFNEWYDKEHIPQLLDVPGFQTGRRYRAIEGTPKDVAVYQLAEENVLKSDGLRAVRENPTTWTKEAHTTVPQHSPRSLSADFLARSLNAKRRGVCAHCAAQRAGGSRRGVQRLV